MSDVLLRPWHGGLGDHLQFSTLPEEFHKQQGRKTYLLDGAEFRNEEIYKLVWEHNPYVLDVKEGEWNAGDLPHFDMSECKTGNWISNWERLHGLEPTNTRPKIYYEPQKVDGLSDTILVDLSSISISHDGKVLGYTVEEIDKTFKKVHKIFSGKKFVSISFKNYIADDINRFEPEVDGTLEIESIFHYCDVIRSSFGICCLYSGPMVLSTAIQRFNPDLKIFCITSPLTFNSDRIQKQGMFYFPEYVDYMVTE
jgi:hypothetical protein|tara:strand:- start:8003 stop:8764 length:762 start_codon:yes stop_codon:yes gene_type:complete